MLRPYLISGPWNHLESLKQVDWNQLGRNLNPKLKFMKTVNLLKKKLKSILGYSREHKKFTRTQFPLELAYVMTAYKGIVEATDSLLYSTMLV